MGLGERLRPMGMTPLRPYPRYIYGPQDLLDLGDIIVSLQKVETFGNIAGNGLRAPAMVPTVCGMDRHDQLTLLVNR